MKELSDLQAYIKGMPEKFSTTNEAYDFIKKITSIYTEIMKRKLTDEEVKTLISIWKENAGETAARIPQASILFAPSESNYQLYKELSREGISAYNAIPGQSPAKANIVLNTMELLDQMKREYNSAEIQDIYDSFNRQLEQDLELEKRVDQSDSSTTVYEPPTAEKSAHVLKGNTDLKQAKKISIITGSVGACGVAATLIISSVMNPGIPLSTVLANNPASIGMLSLFGALFLAFIGAAIFSIPPRSKASKQLSVLNSGATKSHTVETSATPQ